jgi:hypothetical protein
MSDSSENGLSDGKVLVHDGWDAGWAWSTVGAFTRCGYEVFPPRLTGLSGHGVPPIRVTVAEYLGC